MDGKIKKSSRKCAHEEACPFPGFTVCYMLPLIRKANTINLDDIRTPPREIRSKQVGRQLEEQYESLLNRKKASFLRALLIQFGPDLVVPLFKALLCSCVASVMQIVALGWIVRDTRMYLAASSVTFKVTNTNATINDGLELSKLVNLEDIYLPIIYSAIIMLLFALMYHTVVDSYTFDLKHLSAKLRVSACYLLYRKVLRMNHLAATKTTNGQIANLLSNDLNPFDQLNTILGVVHHPLQAVLIGYLLASYHIGSYATLAGVAVILVRVATDLMLGCGFRVYRQRVDMRSDERFRLTSEILLGMQIIKMYAWEKPFKKMASLARKQEIKCIESINLLRSFKSAINFTTSKVVLFVTMVAYISFNGYNLTAETVFVTLAFFNIVRGSFGLFALGVANGVELLVCCQRIDNFLRLPEIGHRPRPHISSCGCKNTVMFTGVCANWSTREDTTDILRDLTITVRLQELVLVVGGVGSGKSSILMAILGELPVSDGWIELSGRLSYAAQESWIFSASIMDNILLGQLLDTHRYQQVIRACSLHHDLEAFLDGDQTLVGESGITLSAGQKARINLARALYREAEIYLLDDPLSAMDMNVAQRIFDQCLLTFLRNKTVILATNQLQFLRYADKVLVVDRQYPAAFGTLQEVAQSKAFGQIGYNKDIFEKETNAHNNYLPQTISKAVAGLVDSIKESTANEETQSESDDLPEVIEEIAAQNSITWRKNNQNFTEVLTSWSTYYYYLSKIFNIWTLIIFILINIVGQSLYHVIDYYLSLWSDSMERKLWQKEHFKEQSFVDLLKRKQVLLIYTGLTILLFISYLFRGMIFFKGTISASKIMQDTSMEKIVNAPMKFFDFNPIGILLKSVSRDIGQIDGLLPQNMCLLGEYTNYVLGIVVLTVIFDVKNLIAAMILLAFGYLIRKYCVDSITRLKQIEDSTRSPVFTHLSNTIVGLQTVRAFEAQDKFIHVFNDYQDTHTGAWFHYFAASHWLSVSQKWLCLGFLISVTIVLLGYTLDSTNASVVGLILSQIITLPIPFSEAFQQTVEIESQMTSIQRIRELNELESETEVMPQVSTDKSIPSTNQLSGLIKFVDVSLRCSPNEQPKLKGLNFTIRPREKIGIVGRTGAGKSSIISALFRLYDFEGRIELDGIDSKSIPLADLRHLISIVPQDPILFSGTIRKNLDPMGKFSDAELWDALDAVMLKTIFSDDARALETTISENGANLSIGQRQLICLARAILRRNKIVVLDEATANVDPETDTLIQCTIARQFRQCTVVTVAQRLITVAHSDRVLVLEAGEVREFGSPYELLINNNSVFRHMVDSSPQQQAVQLRKLIHQAHDDTYSSCSSE